MVVLFGAAGEIRSRCYHTATRTAGTKRPTGAFFRFAHALFESLDTKRTPPCWVVFFLSMGYEKDGFVFLIDGFEPPKLTNLSHSIQHCPEANHPNNE